MAKLTVRKTGSSLGVVIPSDIANLMEIREGTVLEYDIKNKTTIILKKVT